MTAPGEPHRMGQDVRATVDDAERLINALLTMARSDRGLTVCEPIDLATVAEDVLDSTDKGNRRLHLAEAGDDFRRPCAPGALPAR